MAEVQFGRKLENILQDAQYTYKQSELVKIPAMLIRPNPYQARSSYDDEEINKLAESIKEHGLLEPILVRKKQDYYEIIAGERRFRAIQKVGMKDVEVKILDISDAKLCEISLVENLDRKDLNPIERANGYRKLIDIFGYSQEQIAKIFHISPSVVSNSLRLLTLPSQIKEYFSRENFTEGHARLLVSIHNERKQIELAQRVINENLSVRDLENIIAKEKQSITAKPVFAGYKKAKLPLELQELQIKLSNNLNTRVNIHYNNKTNTGNITIKFFDAKHFNEIIDKLLHK